MQKLNRKSLLTNALTPNRTGGHLRKFFQRCDHYITVAHNTYSLYVYLTALVELDQHRRNIMSPLRFPMCNGHVRWLLSNVPHIDHASRGVARTPIVCCAEFGPGTVAIWRFPRFLVDMDSRARGNKTLDWRDGSRDTCHIHTTDLQANRPRCPTDVPSGYDFDFDSMGMGTKWSRSKASGFDFWVRWRWGTCTLLTGRRAEMGICRIIDHGRRLAG